MQLVDGDNAAVAGDAMFVMSTSNEFELWVWVLMGGVLVLKNGRTQLLLELQRLWRHWDLMVEVPVRVVRKWEEGRPGMWLWKVDCY